MFDKPFGRRSLLRGAGALSAVALAPWSAGCAPDDDALTFFFAANPDEREARMRIIDEFARRHPDIKVRAVLSGPGVMQQLSTFCVGGKCPDVLMTWELSYAELADRGVLLDLNPLLARDKAFAQQLKADSVPALYETFAFNGSQFALPEQWSGNYLFYNKRLFADAGVPAPPTTWQRPWDFSGFLDTARALTKRDASGRAAQYGFVNTWVSTYSAGLFAMNNGVPWSNPRLNPTHLNFDDAAFQEAVQFYADLANKHRVAPNASETQSMSTPNLFAVGRAAIALGGHWRYQTYLRAEDLDFDVATGPVGQALIGESCLFVPVLRSALNSEGFANAHRRIGNLSVLTEGPAYSQGLPITPAWEKVNALIDRNFGPVLRGRQPATSLAGLSRSVDEVLRSP
ncbi:ABC transporter substrate-binding protein [Mycobacterium intracellulare]|uniref:ABC transporter substrate-binding protein n=1 Tax=Mycobacterium intracellulare TaxID=1767 RepID=UPI000BAFDD45|nr:extracellular solute-binding protein [Mycobacterium intracellulare]PBA55543.1 ABC transporter [Mycobacterium intracellulare subsp. chimaera]